MLVAVTSSRYVTEPSSSNDSNFKLESLMISKLIFFGMGQLAVPTLKLLDVSIMHVWYSKVKLDTIRPAIRECVFLAFRCVAL